MRLGILLRKLCPDEFADRIWDIDIRRLKERGIEALLIDLDNTILPWKLSEIPPDSAKWVKGAKEQGLKICIASNTHNPRRLQALAAELDVPFVHRIVKPRRKGLAAAIEMIGSTPARTAMIGDQMFTDVLGGKRMGMYTILVKPMTRREFVGTKFSRLLERGLMAYLRRCGMIGTKRAEG